MDKLEVTKEELKADKGATIKGTLNAADVTAKTLEVSTASNLHGMTTMDDASATSIEAASLNVTSAATTNSLTVGQNASIAGDLEVKGKINCLDIPTCRIPYSDEIDRYNSTCNIYIAEYAE